MAVEGQEDGNPTTSDYDAFFSRHERPLYAYLRRLLPSDEVAVEIAQEAFFRAWVRFAEIQGYDRPQAWLYRVATNLAISELRRRQAAPLSHLHGRRASTEECDAGSERADALLTDAVDMEGQIAERDAITRVLRLLGERERATLLLRAVQGFTHEEVAQALGISVANARQIAARARLHFSQLYDAEVEQET